MASIGRWLYRQFAKCLSCLKPAATDEKVEAEDYPQGLNPFENDAEENIQMEKEYPDDLNPFASEEDENKNPNGIDEKVEKGQQEDEYPESLNPFASDDEEYDREIDYPEELNPFADEADQAPVNQSSTTLQYKLTAPNSKGSPSVSFPGEEKTGDGKEESQKKEGDYPESHNPFASEDEENGYPDELNPSADDEESEQDIDYPEKLNPFAHEEDCEADLKVVNQPSSTLSNELTAHTSNDSSSTVKLPEEKKAVDEQDESEQRGDEYPDSRNPFAEDEEKEQDIDYPEQLNPFAHEEDNEADPATVNQPSLVPEQNPPATKGYSSTVPLPDEKKVDDGKNESERHEDEYPDSLNPFASEDEEDVYPEQLNPFAHEEDDEAEIEDGPPVILSIVNNEESAPRASETSGSVPVIYKAEDYDEALNPFASEDEENIDDTAGDLSSLAQLTVATIDGSSLNMASKKREKAKSLKKRRAPDPPVIESKDSVSSEIKSNQPCASSCHPGTKESEA
ncbi:hypothetical protein JTE90_027958 [Oedothorax gibbosus]|uniref:Uncharacterized protein n=1 Tax=Oedothorax gibbosus TaxID=931172 RepID=A0AAV6VFF4_9ARAC|nr:hypothetical protein JTE90_027958 [Oedothorax gibbosus]